MLSHHQAYCFCASGTKCLSLQGNTSSPFLQLFFYLNPLRYFYQTRWLLARGRVEELGMIIEKACLWNNRSLPMSYKKTLNVSQKVSDRRVSIFDLFQKGYKLTTFLMTIIWFSIILTYFGITLHMSTLGGNVYVNTVSSLSHPFPSSRLLNRKVVRVENKQFAINYKFNGIR